MARLLVATLALAGVGCQAATPTLVLSSGALRLGEGSSLGRVSYESLSQAEVLAGVLRAAGLAAGQPAGWEAGHWKDGGAAPQLLALLLSQPDGARQDLREAVSATPTSLALPNAEPVEASVLAARVDAAVAQARMAGLQVGSLLVSDSCSPVRPLADLSLLGGAAAVLSAAASAVRVGGSAEALAASVGAALSPERTTVLLACPGAQPGALDATRAALTGVAPHSLLLVAPAAPAVASEPARRRALLAVPQACDDVCVAQTSLLQFAAVFALYCVLALSGVCCLHALEGPSRFELSAEQKHGNN